MMAVVLLVMGRITDISTTECSQIKPVISSIDTLPVIALANDVIRSLGAGDVMLHAEPGAGKSTALPIALLLSDAFAGRIILLEPRRLAARLVAERLASHLGEKLGQRVGLRMRSDTRVSASTRLVVVTEGVLTRMLQSDPSLADVSLVIFDEFHERSLHADLGLALCREVQAALRDDLRLLLMSATLDTGYVIESMPHIESFRCSVRQHAVEVVYLGERSEPVARQVLNATLIAINNHPGDVLIFLPGVAEIVRIDALIRSQISCPDISVHRLHSAIDTDTQRMATRPARNGKRRIILSTSLAETSITIQGVRVVIDSGLERRACVDVHTGGHRLETITASQASATQRAGRAGRTASGVCFRLWSESSHARRPEHWQPEILRADLAPLLIELSLWGVGDVTALPWLQVPPDAGVRRASDLLARLGLRENGQLTPRGQLVAALPVHPRLGHMLVWAAEHGGGDEACVIAACVENRSGQSTGVDLGVSIDGRQPPSLQRLVSQLKRLLQSIVGNSVTRSASMSKGVILAQGFPDWIARQRPGQPGSYVMACGAEVSFDPDDPLAHSPWLVVAQLGGAGRRARVFKAIRVDIDDLEQCAPQLFETHEQVYWDKHEQRVIAQQRRMLGSLVVRERAMQHIDEHARATMLMEGIRVHGIQSLPWDDASRAWQARMQRLRNLADGDMQTRLPDVSDEQLLHGLENWLLPFVIGVSTLKALQKLALPKVLDCMLDHEQRQMLDAWLPTHYRVPSGSKIRLNYAVSGNPVLPVRLQEMFGCRTNPSLAGGRLALTVQLLSPAGRPVQITGDLANFWINSYPDVKKDLAGRYPKHAWPDNPLDAAPTARAKPKMQGKPRR